VFLIDTNVLSETRKRQRADPGVRAFFSQALADDADLYISSVTVGELRRGVERIRLRGDRAQALILETWLETLLNDYDRKILAVDGDVGQVWGRLRAPHSEHALDKLIAATALIHDLTVVTRNIDDFRATGVRLLNPFSPAVR